MSFAFPILLDDVLVADAAFGAAYDAVSSEERAVIKAAVARMVTVQEKAEALSRHSVTVVRQGFALHERTCPVSWVIVLWDAAYAGPTRVLAALLPAMLAGVPNILACRVGGSGAFPAPLLAALELAGQELVAECAPGVALDIVKACCEADGRGRVVCLGQETVFDEVVRLAASFGVPAYHMASPVRIGVAASSFSGSVQDTYLRFVHPDGILVPFEEDAANGTFSAVFCAEEHMMDFLGNAPLILSPGNEGYWAWPGLGTVFFRETSMGLSGVAAEDDERD